MEITEIKINVSTKLGAIKAYANVTLDNMLAIHNIKILMGIKGMFIAMPSRKVGTKFLDIVHPLNSEFRNKLQERIISEYKKVSQEL